MSNFDHHCNLVNNCIGHRNMRLFVTFIFASYFQAIAQVLSILFLIYRYQSGNIWHATPLLFLMPCCVYVLAAERTTMKMRMLALTFYNLLGAATTLVLCYETLTAFQSCAIGVLCSIGLLWLFMGTHFVGRYCYNIQRGWTEKEKVARSRHERRS